jgi:CheY-like chemotaxis protein
MRDLNRVLHVEDEQDIRDIAKLALADVAGWTVESCASGDEAVTRAVEFKPDLILLDVMMPGMDGLATLAALRELPPLKDIPVVFMTAKVMAEEIGHLQSLGALGVVAKPFDPMTLGDDIAALWRAR